MRKRLWTVTIASLSATALFAGGGQDDSGGSAISGGSSGGYTQSAYLNSMDLPPVDQRIPENPMVLGPGIAGVTEIGEFGGIFANDSPDAANAQGMTNVALPFWGEAKMERPEVLPLAYVSVTSSNGNRTQTVKLRTGLKYSDGSPHTTEDFLFWWEDIAQNSELQDAVPGWLRQGDSVASITAVDDTTLRIDFPQPYPGFDVAIGASCERQCIQSPKAYLSQFHKDYADATELANKVSAAGFEEWTELFRARWDQFGNANTEIPSMMPFTPSTGIEGTPIVWVRNPYFWQVDTEGNQLPYFDEQHSTIVPDAAARSLRAFAGEVNSFGVPLTDLELAQQAADKGDIQLVNFPFKGDLAERTIQFNWFTPDPFKREIFRDVRFRLAISHWAPRQLISDLEFEGLAPIRQIGVFDKENAWYYEPLATLALERDLDQANALLDEMGLTDKDADGFRLGPDGQPITLTIFSVAGWFDDTWNLLVEEMPKIGFKGNFRGVGWGGYGEVFSSMDWELGGGQSDSNYINRDWPSRIGGAWFPSNRWAFPWWRWLESGGSEGEQPPAWAQEMWDLVQSAKQSETDAQLAGTVRKLMEIQAERLIAVELLQFAPRFRAYGPTIGNVQPQFIEMPTAYFEKDPAKRAVTLP